MEATEKDILRGGQFLVKEIDCEDIFTPEDFNEDQLMMKEAVTEFVDREIWSKKAQFEKKGRFQRRSAYDERSCN